MPIPQHERIPTPKIQGLGQLSDTAAKITGAGNQAMLTSLNGGRIALNQIAFNVGKLKQPEPQAADAGLDLAVTNAGDEAQLALIGAIETLAAEAEALTGAAARNVSAGFAKKAQKARYDLLGGIRDNALRNEIGQKAEAFIANKARKLQEHEDCEERKLWEQNQELKLESIRREALDNFNDPSILRRDLDVMDAVIEETGLHQGLAADEIARNKRRNQQELITAKIARGLENDEPAEARKAFDTFGGLLDKDEREPMALQIAHAETAHAAREQQRADLGREEERLELRGLLQTAELGGSTQELRRWGRKHKDFALEAHDRADALETAFNGLLAGAPMFAFLAAERDGLRTQLESGTLDEAGYGAKAARLEAKSLYMNEFAQKFRQDPKAFIVNALVKHDDAAAYSPEAVTGMSLGLQQAQGISPLDARYLTNQEKLTFSQSLSALTDPTEKTQSILGIYKTYGKFGGNVLQELDLHDEAVKAIRLLDNDISRLPDMAGVIEAATYKGYAPSPEGRKRDAVLQEAYNTPYGAAITAIYSGLSNVPAAVALKQKNDRFLSNYLSFGYDLNVFSRYFEIINNDHAACIIPKNTDFIRQNIEEVTTGLIGGLTDYLSCFGPNGKSKLKWICNDDEVLALIDIAAGVPVLRTDGSPVILDLEEAKIMNLTAAVIQQALPLCRPGGNLDIQDAADDFDENRTMGNGNTVGEV